MCLASKPKIPNPAPPPPPPKRLLTPEQELAQRDAKSSQDASRIGKGDLRIELNDNVGGNGLRIPL